MIPSIDATRTRFSDPVLTPAEIVASADALIPELVARQAETERRSFCPEDRHGYFKQNDFYRILVPRRYGGYESGIETFFRTADGRWAISGAWPYCLHGNLEYCGGQLCYMTLEAARLVVGIARGALDACEELARKRPTPLPPITALTQAWRSLSTMRTHLGLSVLLRTVAVRELGRARLGVERS
jgi:alkylation response protein AidB-like acyl-CoA dehydrogenase